MYTSLPFDIGYGVKCILLWVYYDVVLTIGMAMEIIITLEDRFYRVNNGERSEELVSSSHFSHVSTLSVFYRLNNGERDYIKIVIKIINYVFQLLIYNVSYIGVHIFFNDFIDFVRFLYLSTNSYVR